MPTQPAANNPSESPKQPKYQPQQAAETLPFNQIIGDTGDPRGKELSPAPGGPATPGAQAQTAKPKSLVGQTFDDLELIAELGRGGMGVVYKAKQKSLDRMVAVKLLLAEHFVDPVRLARFQAEARAAASLTHANIVQVYQIGECALGHYFTMEFVEGHSLETILQRGKIPIAAALSVMTVVADAVHYAHTKGIVHRDLKPGNIMIDRTRRPVVMDFGIAKFVGKSTSLTQQGVVVGTPAYMAPEQAGEGTDPVGPRSDVYALGAILYTALTGRLPFEEETPLRTILKVISPEMPPSVRSLRPRVPAHLDSICMKCLAKRAADRYPTAQALAEELRRFRAIRKGEATIERKKSGTTMRVSALPSVLLVSRSGKEFRIFQDKTVMGRSSDCDIPVRAADVSKRHCQILLQRGEVWVEDLGSANGTFINDQRVKRAVLEDGDRLRLADCEFTVCTRDTAS
jgi:serine/threonine protein kinase